MPKQSIALILDISSQKSAAYLVNSSGQVVAEATHIMQERDPLELIYTVRSTIHKALQKYPKGAKQLIAMGICTAETPILIWDKDTGLPLSNLDPNPQDGESIIKKWKQAKLCDTLMERNGQIIHPLLPICRAKHLSQDPKIAEQIKKKKALIGTLDTWLLYHLTQLKTHKSSLCHSLVTGLVNKKTLKWDPFIVSECGIDGIKLPKIEENPSIFGHCQHFSPLPDGLPIVAMTTKSNASLLGNAIHKFQNARLYYKDYGQIIVNTGQSPAATANHSSIIKLPPAQKTTFAQKAFTPFPEFAAQWLPILEDTLDPKQLANTQVNVDNTEGVYIIPVQKRNGIHETFSPKLNIFGIGPESTPQHIMRAYFECMAYLCTQSVRMLENDCNITLKEVVASGPLAKNDFLLQFQADTLQLPIIRRKSNIDRVLGTLHLVNQHNPFLNEKASTEKLNPIDKTFIPNLDPISSYAQFNRWEAVQSQLKTL